MVSPLVCFSPWGNSLISSPSEWREQFFLLTKDKVILNTWQLLGRAVLLTSSVLAELSERGRTDRCSYLITGQVLLSSQWRRGAGRTVSLLSSTCSSLYLLVFPLTLSSFPCSPLCQPSSQSVCCFITTVIVVSTQPLLSPVAADTIESQSCALCDGADCRGPYRNHIPTWNRLTVSPQRSIGCQRRASQITTICTAACNVCPPQQQARKETYMHG